MFEQIISFYVCACVILFLSDYREIRVTVVIQYKILGNRPDRMLHACSAQVVSTISDQAHDRVDRALNCGDMA